MSRRLVLNGNSEGVLEEHAGPYAVIECETEDAFQFLQEALAYYKRCIDEGRFKPLTLDELQKMNGQSVFIDVDWGFVCNFEGLAIVQKVGSEGICLNFNGKQHSLLNDWYGQIQKPRWIAYRDVKSIIR